MWKILSADEQERASRFLVVRDRDRFTAARGLLRILIGACQTCAPEAVRFQYSAEGKPSLLAAENTQGLQFNLAHSQEVMLLGIVSGRRIGVDVEQINPKIDCQKLAKRFFSLAEQQALDELSPSEKNTAWFRFWTVKEAFLKAVGVGLTLSPDAVEVSGEQPVRLLRIAGDTLEASRWHTEALSPCDGFTAAVVVEGADPTNIHCRRWRW